MDCAIVARDEELEVAHHVLAGAREGPRGLLIEGEAGIGKTAVWRAALDDAAAQKYRVLACVAEEAEARLSFAGLSDLLGAVSDAAVAALPAPQREAIEVALVRRATGSRRTPDPRSVAVALRTLLVDLARTRPVVVAVDDVQWLDAATARALAFAARRLDGQRVAVLATLRAPVTAPEPLGLERALGAQLTRVRLGPLNPVALRAVLERGLGHTYPRPTLMRIARISRGNPLFALEVARAIGKQPALEPGAPLPVPDSLRELVVGRVADLSPRARRTLLVAAALRHPTAELVERASSAAGLAAAEDAGLLRMDGDRVAFTHPLYASAVYTAAASGRRRAMHGQLAELVADAEERVRHRALAAGRPDEQVAAALEDAAAQARARGAWESASELLEQARALTPSDHPEAARRRGVLAAEHNVHAGDRPRARALLEDVLSTTPRGPTRGDALGLLAEICSNDGSFADAARLLEEALEYAEDPALAVRIELNLTYVHFNDLGDSGAADLHAGRALERAAAFGDDAALGAALGVRAIVDFLLGRGVDWSRVERAVALEDPGALLPLALRPSMIAALLKLYVGRVPEARAELMALRLASIDSGDESDLALVLFWLAWAETLSGAFATAASLAQEAADHAAHTGSDSSLGWALAQRAIVHAHRGEAAEARADAQAATEICTRLGLRPPLLWVAAALGLLELSLGNAAGAWTATGPLAEAHEAHGIAEPSTVFLPATLEALVGLGELDRAERLLESFAGRARELDRIWALATSARCRGLLEAARGDLPRAEEALDHALAEHARVEMPFELARTLLVLGQVRRRRRRKRAAREALEQALALFEQMGAPLWSRRAREEIDRLGARRGPGELTPTEARVAELAAEGQSNKEIARALFVAVHTVEVHLSHAYAKLGIRSRRRLAARLSDEARRLEV